MKRIISISLLVCFLIPLFCGCSNKKPPIPTIVQPEESKITAICNLATLECYFHNVAKSQSKGILGIEATKKNFWIEYSGTVKIGIDLSQVQCSISDDQVSITMPKAKVLDINVDISTYNEDSYYIDSSSLFKSKISAEDQTAAINEAQKQMRATADANEPLLLKAQTRAKKMIENYINQISDLSGKKYIINWKNPAESQTEQQQ